MSEPIKDYVKFNVLGIEEDLVSEEDKELIKKLNVRKHILLRYQGYKDYVIETYSLNRQADIFNGLKARQGHKARITFINSRGYPVEITGAEVEGTALFLRCVFCKTRKTFGMRLETFLGELFKGNITKVKPDGFYNSYLLPIPASLRETENKLNEIKEKYNKIYKERESALQEQYEKELAKFNRIKKEAKSERYQLSNEEALERAKTFKGLDRVKDYWNTKLTEDEKHQLIDWICDNVYSIRVYGLTNGQSGNTLLNEYANIGDVKYREVKTNEEGKITSQDSIVAHISFKQIADAPMDILKKVVSTKGRNENVFYNNRLNDKNLALFLLSEYHWKGFKAGVRNLYREIINF